jgi:hypothetical protein
MKELRYQKDGDNHDEYVVVFDAERASFLRRYPELLTGPPYYCRRLAKAATKAGGHLPMRRDWSQWRYDPEYGCTVPIGLLRQMLKELDET